MEWVGHEAYTWGRREMHSILVGMPAGKTPFQKLGIHGSLILQWILKKYEDHPERKDSFGKKYKQNKI